MSLMDAIARRREAKMERKEIYIEAYRKMEPEYIRKKAMADLARKYAAKKPVDRMKRLDDSLKKMDAAFASLNGPKKRR